MSFPYRLLAVFVHSQAVQVIIMRLIDITLFGYGLVLFRRVLRKVGLSTALANILLFLLALVPVVPQLAGQINYDDLLFPVVAAVCLVTFRLTDELKAKKPSAKTVLSLVVLMLLATLVKYAFLPIGLAVVVYVVVLIHRTYRHNFKQLATVLWLDFRGQSRWVKIALPLVLLVALVFGTEREGYNLIKYHSLVPDCAKVLSVKDCSAYSAWYFNYNNHQQLTSATPMPYNNIFRYTWQWFYWMWYRLFFVVNGPASDFNTLPPLPLPSYSAIVVGLFGVVALVKWHRRIFTRNPYVWLLLLICVIYAASLFVKGYATYRYTAVLENMNGRYLIPILLPLVAIMGLALSRLLGRSMAPKVAAALVIILMFLEGGGALTFILNSDESWYWPNNAVKKVNHAAMKVTKHVVVKGHTPLP